MLAITMMSTRYIYIIHGSYTHEMKLYLHRTCYGLDSSQFGTISHLEHNLEYTINVKIFMDTIFRDLGEEIFMGENGPPVINVSNSSCVQIFVGLIFVDFACPQKLIPSEISAITVHFALDPRTFGYKNLNPNVDLLVSMQVMSMALNS